MLLRLRNAVASMHESNVHQERTANNLANVNTVGYKRDRLFTTALNERLNNELVPESDRLVEQGADLAAGSLEQTGNPLDVALRGDGFFEALDENTGALRYTRAGRFTTDADGTLRLPDGQAVQGAEGNIVLPPGGGPVEIGQDGSIRQNGQAVGRLRVVTFADPSALQRLDGSAFAAGGAPPEDVAAPDVLQGFIETSNVNAVREMTDMIEQFRRFESQQKSIQTLNDLLGQLVRDTGRF